MSRKADIRGYVNPFVPGGKTEAGQRAGMSPDAVIFVEDRTGKVIDGFLRTLRVGSIIEVEEVHYLAPGNGRADKRRRILAERVKEARRRKAAIKENATGLRSDKCDLPAMLLRGYEQIATSGRARKGKLRGAPPKWPREPATKEDYKLIWRDRRHKNDVERHAAILARFGKAPSIGWLRRNIGSPHK